MNPPIANSRPAKLTHVQTILYEIDMLKFAVRSFGEADGFSSWRNLECFLLHFRNLIEFFGKPPDDRDTLSVLKPGSFSNDPQIQEDLRKLYRNGLWKKYEVRRDEEENDKISRYLQHCTAERVNDKSWKVREMVEELLPLIDQRKILPDKDRPWRRVPNLDQVAVAMIAESHSTATITKAGTLVYPVVDEEERER